MTATTARAARAAISLRPRFDFRVATPAPFSAPIAAPGSPAPSAAPREAPLATSFSPLLMSWASVLSRRASLIVPVTDRAFASFPPAAAPILLRAVAAPAADVRGEVAGAGGVTPLAFARRWADALGAAAGAGGRFVSPATPGAGVMAGGTAGAGRADVELDGGASGCWSREGLSSGLRGVAWLVRPSRGARAGGAAGRVAVGGVF